MKQPYAVEVAANAGRLLGQCLRNDHDRSVVTQNMQAKMMDMFKGAV